MPKVEVIVEGLALWIDRGTYWDVLFPVCHEAERRQHRPMLSVSIGGWETVPSRKLKGQMLDLIHLVPGAAQKMRADWMLPIKRSPGNPHKKPLPNAASADVVASLRLPKRGIAPLSRKLAGPVRFDGKSDRHLDFGTLWQAEIPSDQLLLVLRKRKTQQEKETLLLDGGGMTITITTRNQTRREHNGSWVPTERGEIREAKDILDLASSTQSLPIYDGDALDFAPQSATAGAARRESPFRLCPQGYCEDCPDD